ncbi:MAG: prepilin-type N-terminal cleavage/methylation domain-containing protein, partial [Coriobacteriales bacterium]|nr:prepilin-type N-terminal cleavage/methylation domain-containing protein [Coriobacteriales bacterium]
MPGGGGAHSLVLLQSTNHYEGASVRAKDAAQAPVPGGFLYPDSSFGKKNGARTVAAWAPYTENPSSNSPQPRRLSSSTSPAAPHQGSPVCETHRTFPQQGAIQRRAGSVSFRSLCSPAKKRAGFTLVELIVVIVILGIL